MCEECNTEDDPEKLLLCDYCGAGYHTYYVGMDEVPPGAWYCQRCDTIRTKKGHELDVTLDEPLYQYLEGMDIGVFDEFDRPKIKQRAKKYFLHRQRLYR